MATAKGGRTTPRKRPQPEVEVAFNPDQLTVGDLVDLEEHFGLTIDKLMSMANGVNLKTLGAKTLAALAFLYKRQVDPEFPAEDARKVPLTEIFNALSGGQPGTPPKPRLAGKGGGPETRPTDGG